MAYDFVLPEFLEDCDADTIHRRMLDELPADIDKTEGGFPWDFTRPTALIAAELLQFYIPEVIKLMFPQWSSGQFLDYLAATSHTKRKAETYAEAVVEITGEAGTLIPAGTILATAATNGQPSIEFATLETCVLDDQGKGSVTVRALIAGTESNVGPGTITLMSEPIEGITSMTNPQKASGGAEAESDDDLRERILEADSTEDISYIGNVSDYRRWAREVDGIGDAIVVPEWDGPETIKIVCLDANGEAANQSLLTAVYNHIMSPDDPEKRLAPPNVILTVAAPDLVNITYAFTVELDDAFELDAIVADFRKQLDAYYKTVSSDGMVKYNKVHSILTNIQGVADFEGLTMNGGTENITIDQDEYPYTLAINAGEAD